MCPIGKVADKYKGAAIMKKISAIWFTFMLLAFCGTGFAETPHELGPFILGHDIAEFAEFVQMETDLPIRYMENIREVETRPIKGFKSGLVSYGTCAAPNRIVRVKLKYSDDTKAFYEKLKKRIDDRFGKSDEYRGDPFHIVIGWKWSFLDKDNNNISLILQHNTRDEEEKMGNSIKLTMTSLLESDWECYRKKQQLEKTHDGTLKPQEMELDQTGWDLFMPR